MHAPVFCFFSAFSVSFLSPSFSLSLSSPLPPVPFPSFLLNRSLSALLSYFFLPTRSLLTASVYVAPTNVTGGMPGSPSTLARSLKKPLSAKVHRVTPDWVAQSLQRGVRLREEDFFPSLLSEAPPRGHAAETSGTEPLSTAASQPQRHHISHDHSATLLCQLHVRADAPNANAGLIAELLRMAEHYGSTLPPTRDDSQAHTRRELAYRRIVAGLRGYPWPITSGSQAKEHIMYLNDKTADRIDEYLNTGHIAEVDRLCNTQYSKSMRVLSSIHGVGVKTAHRWYEAGVRTLEDIDRKGIKLTTFQRVRDDS